MRTLAQVTEEQLATFFSECGRVVDCRICGDANSAMRFAFLEFSEVDAAHRVRPIISRRGISTSAQRAGSMAGGGPCG